VFCGAVRVRALPAPRYDAANSALYDKMPYNHLKEKLAGLGLDVGAGTPEALTAFTQAETAKWAKVVKESGAKLD
jgi:tripartite-type tricarboxylate transporter receptor subunit TctC